MPLLCIIVLVKCASQHFVSHAFFKGGRDTSFNNLGNSPH